MAFWDHYYQKHDEKPDELQETVTYLGRAKKFDQVEAVITGYLRHHSNLAETWMYESLAIACDINKRGPEKVKTALGYAAYCAKRSRKFDQLVLVADLLYLRGYYEPFQIKVGNQTELLGVGQLLDLAYEGAPHLAVPPMMSINLAQKTKDPERMAAALEQLLSLGWPGPDGFDDKMRMDAQRETEKLAKTLREDDHTAEANILLTRLTESEGRDLFVRLTWVGEADLDLIVQEPLGVTVSHDLKRSVFGGSLIKEGVGKKRSEEIYVCPRGFDGDYTIKVDTVFNSLDTPIKDATVEVIMHEGLSGEHKETHKVSVDKPTPIVVHLTGGRRKKVLPFVAPPAPAPASVATSPPAAPATDARTGKAAKKPKASVPPQNKAADALGTTPSAPRQPIDSNAGAKPKAPKP